MTSLYSTIRWQMVGTGFYPLGPRSINGGLIPLSSTKWGKTYYIRIYKTDFIFSVHSIYRYSINSCRDRRQLFTVSLFVSVRYWKRKFPHEKSTQNPFLCHCNISFAIYRQFQENTFLQKFFYYLHF